MNVHKLLEQKIPLKDYTELVKGWEDRTSVPSLTFSRARVDGDRKGGVGGTNPGTTSRTGETHMLRYVRPYYGGIRIPKTPTFPYGLVQPYLILKSLTTVMKNNEKLTLFECLRHYFPVSLDEIGMIVMTLMKDQTF